MEAPYRARPDLAKLNDGPILLEDSQWHDWINEKEALCREKRLVLCDPALLPDHLHALTQQVLSFFKSSIPNGPVDAEGRFAWRNGYAAGSPVESLAALSLSLQEDFAIMADLDGKGLRAAVLSVSFPSGWSPEEKIGQSMSALHEPVADNAQLQAAMPALSHAISTKGPFVRHVWTLADSSRRSRRPGSVQTTAIQHAHELWFRWERQVTIPLGTGVSLFLIRLGLAPYRAIVRDTSDYNLLVNTLQSMTPAMVAYKNLHRIRELVLQSGAP